MRLKATDIMFIVTSLMIDFTNQSFGPREYERVVILVLKMVSMSFFINHFIANCLQSYLSVFRCVSGAVIDPRQTNTRHDKLWT